jgi:4-amino-4-deoxy-L-arabinose transferase-like glycosyltransferase
MSVDGKVLGVFCAGLILRLAFVLAYPQPAVVNDAAAYDAQAHDLAFKTGFWEGLKDARQFSKGPVYPLVLAAVYRTAGDHHPAIRVFQAVVSSVVILVVYALAGMVFGRQVAWLSAVLTAIYPPFISYAGWLLTETLSVFLLAMFVWLLVRAATHGSKPLWVMAGASGGLLVLHRQEMLLLVVLSAVVMMWRLRAKRSWMGMFAAACALTVLPWTFRNALVLHRVILVSPGGGHPLWISTVETKGAEWDPRAPYMDEYRALVQGADPVEADSRLRRDALRRIVEDPLGYLTLCVKRLPAFWLGGHSNTFARLEDRVGSYLKEGRYLHVIVKLLMLAFNLGLMLLGGVGIVLAWRQPAEASRYAPVLALPIFVKAVTHVFLFATLRYQVPIMSFMIIFAACALSALRPSMSASKGGR